MKVHVWIMAARPLELFLYLLYSFPLKCLSVVRFSFYSVFTADSLSLPSNPHSHPCYTTSSSITAPPPHPLPLCLSSTLSLPLCACSGLAQCAELCWQLRGQADRRQVPGAKVALQHNIGLGGAVVVTLYRMGFPQEARWAIIANNFSLGWTK